MPGTRSGSRMDVKSGLDAGTNWSATVLFDFLSRSIKLESWNNSFDVRLTLDGTNFYDDFEIDPDRPLDLWFEAVGYQIKNSVVGAVSRYQLIAEV